MRLRIKRIHQSIGFQAAVGIGGSRHFRYETHRAYKYGRPKRKLFIPVAEFVVNGRVFSRENISHIQFRGIKKESSDLNTK